MSDERRWRWNGSWPLLHWVVGGIKSPRRPAYCWLSTIGSPKSDSKKLVPSPQSIGPIHTQCDAASMPSCWEAKKQVYKYYRTLGGSKKDHWAADVWDPRVLEVFATTPWDEAYSVLGTPPSYPGGGGAMEDESGGGGGASGLIQDLCSPKARTPLKNGTPSVHVTVPEPTQDQVMRGGHLFDIISEN